VLVPWYEVDPAAEIASRGAIGDLLGQADASGVVRRDDLVIDRD
jgi:2-amino-4-hydroxy-6-hydroxymethyldihydropteridine diphosphokinase